MTTVILADDHPFLRAGVAAVLKGSPFQLIANAASGDEALALVESHDPDIVILDVRMPGRDGIETLQALRAKGDLRPVVLLTAHLDDRKLLAALAAGVDGIVLKEGAESSLIGTLHQVEAGGRAIPEDLSERAAQLARDGIDACPFERLNVRERSLARLVATGVRNREISVRLGISEGTVKVYLHGVYRKLGVATRTELALLAHRYGFE